jgi:hypothetical protein
MAQWEVKSATTEGDQGTRMLDIYLEEGWEPFAVVRDVQGRDWIYLRRYAKVRA